MESLTLQVDGPITGRAYKRDFTVFVQKAFLLGLFSGELIIGGNFAFQNGLGLTIKAASTNSPWTYLREGLLSEGFVRLRFGGLIFCRAHFFFFGGGGSYYREFYGILTLWIKSSS